MASIMITNPAIIEGMELTTRTFNNREISLHKRISILKLSVFALNVMIANITDGALNDVRNPFIIDLLLPIFIETLYR